MVDQRETHLRLWQEERADVRQRLLLAVIASAACVVAAGVVLGLMILATTSAPEYRDAMGALVPGSFVLMALGGAGWALVTMCRRDVSEHQRRAELLQRELVLPAAVQVRALAPMSVSARGVPQSGEGLLACLMFTHWGVILSGLIALVVSAP